MSNFKIGGRVKVVSDGDYIKHKGLVGKEGIIVKLGTPYSWMVEIDGYDYPMNNDELELVAEENQAPKVLDNLEQGDILVDKDGDERTVLAVVSKVYFLSNVNEPEAYGRAWTLKEIKSNLMLRSLWKPQPTKLTLAQVSDKLGYDVEIVEEV